MDEEMEEWSDERDNSHSSISSGELRPIEDTSANFVVFNYNDPSSHSGIIQAVIRNDIEKIQELIARGKSVRTIDNNGNTPLHVAALTSSVDNIDIITYLLSLKDVDKNAKNFLGQTPLLLSAMAMKETAALKLLEAGANVELLSNEDVTPLHHSVRFSTKLSEKLILAGADINSADYSGDTPLHDSIIYGDIEILCMLLYHNADTTIQNSVGLTPFMQCLVLNQFERADLLFEYVVDFNLATAENMSTLFLAITSGYPRIKEMIEQGADVNHKNEIYNVLTLNVVISPADFKIVWKLWDYKNVWDDCWPNILIYILKDEQTDAEYKETIIRYILENDDFKRTMDLTEDSKKYPLIYPLVDNLFLMNVPYETVHSLCAILFSCNVIIYDVDLDMVYERFGYCELFEVMLYMDIKETHLKKFNKFPHLVYVIDENNDITTRLLGNYSNSILGTIDFENIFDHIIHPGVKTFIRAAIDNNAPHLIKQDLINYLDILPSVPKLLDLARNKLRDYLCRKYHIKHSCQFHTLVKIMDIPVQLKKLITFQIPIYRNYIGPEYFFSRKRWKLREERMILLDRYFYSTPFPFSSEYPNQILE